MKRITNTWRKEQLLTLPLLISKPEYPGMQTTMVDLQYQAYLDVDDSAIGPELLHMAKKNTIKIDDLSPPVIDDVKPDDAQLIAEALEAEPEDAGENND